jgi:hypothetical protein
MPFRTLHLHDVPGGIEGLDGRGDLGHVPGNSGGLFAGIGHLNNAFVHGSGLAFASIPMKFQARALHGQNHRPVAGGRSAASALLLIGFGGALCRSELMVFQVGHARTIRLLYARRQHGRFRNVGRAT